jgi:hypothetical protein
MLRRDGQRGQALLIVLTFIATFALILWAAAFFVSGSFKAQGGVVADTKATYAVDAALQWGLGYVRLNSLTCAAATPPITPAIPSPGPVVNGYSATVTISADATCQPGARVFNLSAQAGPRSGQAQVSLTGITYVQGANAGNENAGSVSRAFPSSVVAGNTIIVVVVTTGAQPTTVTDTAANTYTMAVANDANANNTQVSIWYAANVVGGAITVTVTLTQPADNGIAIHEYRGLASASPLDRTAGAGGRSAAPASGATPATSQASELVFSATGNNKFGAVFTAGAGFTLRQSLSDGITEDIASEDRVASATGAQTGAFTTNIVTDWSCVVATFKGASGSWTLGAFVLQ